MLNKSTSVLKYLILALLLYMPIFGFLNTLPIRLWDESRLAINAYEMYKNGNYIVTHFQGEPDMWNTKPPFMIWCQVFFMKFIGVNELSVRLPSAFAAFFTCLSLLFFSKKYLRSFLFGFIAILILITSHGYVAVHSTRSGDYDALLTFFIVAGAILYFLYSETHKNKYLYLFFLSIALAVLTKSIAGLIILPALFIYTIWRRQLLQMLKNKHLYLGLLSFLILTLGYYFLREYQNPGYLNAAFYNDMGGRYLKSLDHHKEEFWYYYNNIITFQYSNWFPLLPLGFAIGLLNKDKRFFKLTVFFSLIIVVYFLVISSAQTKLQWYDVPLYPFLSLMVAISIFYVADWIKEKSSISHSSLKNLIPWLFLILVFQSPYQKIIAETYKPKEYFWDVEFYKMSNYLRQALKGEHDLNNVYLVEDGENAHHLFYINLLNDKGINISFKEKSKIKDGDKIIFHQKDMKLYIESNYEYEVLENVGNIFKYKIYGEK